MKSFRLYTYYFIAIGTVLCSLLACKKDADSPEANLAKELTKYSFSYMQRGYAVRLNGIAYSDSTVSFRGFPVSLSSAASQETEVKAEIDPSLVNTYNSLYSEKNPSFDTSSFRLSLNGSFHIKAGQLTATDSLYVLLKSATKLKDSTAYLIPVRLTATNGAQLATPIVFFKMFVATARMTAFLNSGSTFGYSYPYSRNGSQFFGYTLSKDANGQLVAPALVRISTLMTANMRFPQSELHVYGAVNVSDSLVRAFSTYTGLNYTAFPAGTYELSRRMITIARNNSYGSDSLQVNLQNYDRFQTGKYYLLGVKITGESSDLFSVPGSSDPNSTALISVYINP